MGRGPPVVLGAELRAAEHGAHLGLEVGVGLGERPQADKEMHRVHRGHAPGGDPALDHLRLVGHQGAQLAAQVVADLGRAVEEFVGEDPGGVGALGGEAHLGRDVMAQGLAGVGVGGDAVGLGQPQAQDVAGKVDAVEQAKAEIDQKRQEFESGWAALQPRVQAISKSDPKYAEIEPQLQEIAQIQSAMETAAQGHDYVQAAQQLQDLSGKVEAYEQAMKEVDDKPRRDYEEAAAAVKDKVEDCLVMARSYPPLNADKQAVTTAQQQMEAAAKAGDYEKARQLATELGTKADAYLKKAGEEQKKYDDKGAEISKALDDANYFSRDDVARDYANSLSKDEIKFLPTEVRNRLMQEMQGR